MSKLIFFIIIILAFLFIMLIYENEVYPQINPLNITISRDSTDGAVQNSYIYPRVGMGTGNTYSSYDWTYNNIGIPAYIILTGNQPLMAAKFNLQWDSSKIDINVAEGDLFQNQILKVKNISLSNMEINISSLNGNVLPVAGKSLLKIYIKVFKVGVDSILINNCSLRYYDAVNDEQNIIPVVTTLGIVKFYPGDFATSRLIQNRGDGDVNYQDASVFGQHYNSIVNNDTLYKVKFDIYPTQNNLDYYSLPVGDGTINFYDLIIFALGYNYEANGNLFIKRNESLNPKSVIFDIGEPLYSNGDILKLPVSVSGDVNDLRGYSVKILFNEKLLEYLDFNDKKDIPKENSIAFTKTTGNEIQVDFAVLGAKSNVINSAGNIFDLTFKRKTNNKLSASDFAIIDVIAVNSYTELFNVKIQN